MSTSLGCSTKGIPCLVLSVNEAGCWQLDGVWAKAREMLRVTGQSSAISSISTCHADYSLQVRAHGWWDPQTQGLLDPKPYFLLIPGCTGNMSVGAAAL